MKSFLLIPIVVVNNENNTFEKIARIDPQEIEYYYPGAYNGTIIVMKSRSSFMTPLECEQIDQARTLYAEKLKHPFTGDVAISFAPKPDLHVAD